MSDLKERFWHLVFEMEREAYGMDINQATAELERLLNERDDSERVMRVACEANKQFKSELKRLRKTISEFLDAISGVPMRAIDCNQEEVDRLQRKLEKQCEKRSEVEMDG